MPDHSSIRPVSFEPVGEGWPSAVLRGEDRVDFVGCPATGAGMVVLRNLADVQLCLTDSRFGVSAVPEEHILTGAQVQHPDGLLRLDSPRLCDIRRLINPFHTAKYVESGRQSIDTIATDLISSFADDKVGSQIDFSRDYSEPFVARSVCKTLGVGIENWPLLLASANASLGVINDIADVTERERAWHDLYEFYDNIVNEKRRNPDEATISQVVRVLDKNDYSHEEIVRTCASISNGFPAVLPVLDVAVIELLRRPQVVAECLEQPESWSNVVNELMRFKAHFSILLPRLALEDVQLGDMKIEGGTVVLPSISGATRDPARTECPNDFVPGQKAAKNIVFGAGHHYCPGAALTRQWLEVGLKTFFTHFPDAQLNVLPSELEWQSGSLSVPKAIPVKLAC